jgi:tRNA(Arg) A34 adenosine deaminase TadA
MPSERTALAEREGFPLVVELALPAWVNQVIGNGGDRFDTVEERMGLVVRLARANVEHGTGGPFAAAIFDREGGLVSAGVNQVMASNIPVAHAEIIAIAIAGSRLGSFDLGAQGASALVTSTEPCAMCLGAVPWSGVTGLVCGARDEDARAIGFEEGAKPPDWELGLTLRGIEVTRDVLREEAAAVLRLYVERGGVIYNAGQARPL